VSSLRLTILALFLIVPAAARAADGGVHLYLQPLPSEAARLTFAIASVSAVTSSGSEYPLEVNLQAVGPASAARQRLLASGRLPSGSYAGFRFKIARAALRGEHDEVALVVADTPARLDVPFVVTGQQASLFWLTLKYQDSISDGFAFSPVFSAVVPARPIADHAGFVTNSGSNTITVFDKSLGQAVAIIDTCARPAGMALDQHRRLAYVACSRDDEIQSIDVAAADVVERGRLFPGDGPKEVALTPDGTTLLSANAGSNSVTFFDAASLARQERVEVGSGPGSLLIDAAGRRAFVFNTLSSSVSVIDIASRSLVATISTESAPLRGQFNARGDRLYVIHERSPFMTVVDPRQLTVITRARVRSGLSAIKVDSVRNLVYVGAADDTTIEFYDPNTLVPVNSMKTRAGVSYLTVDAEDSTLYMVSPDTRSLVVGSLADRTIVSEIDVDEGPCWVAVMGER
jgi:YVTN family beta-propeller protein